MNASVRLRDLKLLSFDCYGTLIDWEQGITASLSSLKQRLARPFSDELLLELFAECESLQEEATPALPYSALLGLVYRRLEQRLGLEACSSQALAFAAAVPNWPAFPDSTAALAQLKRGFKLMILSNVDALSFAASQLRLGVTFDAVYSAERIGWYKPALANFEFLIEPAKIEFGIAQHQILHVAQSLYHDHVPANQIGLASAFIDRRHARVGHGATAAPAATVRFDCRFTSMAQFALAARLEQEG